MLGVLIGAPSASALPGQLDSSFGGDGRVATYFDFRHGAAAKSVARQPDGKIVAAGGPDRFNVARYTASGELDRSFSGDGKQTTGVPGFSEASGYLQAEAVAVQRDGKVVVAGSVVTDGVKFAVARYLPDGRLDESFAGDGKRPISFDASAGIDAYGQAMILQPDGKIVVVGRTFGPGGDGGRYYNFVLARLNPNGSLDTSFSGDGRRLVDVEGSWDSANDVVRQADGRIVVAGGAELGTNRRFVLARFLPSGRLDPTFSSDGKQYTDVRAGGGGDTGGMSSPGDDEAHGLGMQPDGKIVAVGGTYVARIGPTRWNYDVALVRYKPSGALDPTFSSDGKQTTDFTGEYDAAQGLVVQPDGRIVVAGTASTHDGNPDRNFADRNFGLARYTATGRLDPTFSSDGKTMTGFGANEETAEDILRQPDGKLVAGGGTLGPRFALARYRG
jgi:uncharacterized delta-60 repeat protein